MSRARALSRVSHEYFNGIMNKLTFKRMWSPNRGDDGTYGLRKRSPCWDFHFLSAKMAANRRTLFRAAATRQKLANILFFHPFGFVPWQGRRVRKRTLRTFAVTADHAYARIARGSLWPSVTVYSFRSYFVPVALKKSQSTRGKYACAPDDGVVTHPDMSRQLLERW